MPKFRKKPVVIEAMKYNGGRSADQDLIDWIETGNRRCVVHATHLVIATLEGDMIASPGDWIIKGIKGEFYPCKPDIFEATYEPVEAV